MTSALDMINNKKSIWLKCVETGEEKSIDDWVDLISQKLGTRPKVVKKHLLHQTQKLMSGVAYGVRWKRGY